MRVEVRTLIERASRWLVTNRRPPLDSQATVDFFGDTVRTVMASMPDIMTGVVWKDFERTRKRLAKAGVPDDLAVKIAVLPPAYPLLTVVQIAKHDDVDPLQVARLHAALAKRLGLGEFLSQVVALPRDDRWRTMARAALRDDLYGVHAQLTEQVIHETDADLNPGDRLAALGAGARPDGYQDRCDAARDHLGRDRPGPAVGGPSGGALAADLRPSRVT